MSKKNIIIFIGILLIFCSHPKEKLKNIQTIRTDSISIKYFEILNGLKLNYVQYYRCLSMNEKELREFGVPTNDSVFKRDSVLFFNSYNKFFKQDYSFVEWLLSFKNDFRHSNLWQQSMLPYSSTMTVCNTSISNSCAAIILIDNFLNGEQIECYSCSDKEFSVKVRYKVTEQFLNKNKGKSIVELRKLWKSYCYFE